MSLPNTHFGPEYIKKLLLGNKKLFFDGIGGISMNSLAHVSFLMGHTVSGYDKTKSEITSKLESIGIKVYYTPSADHVKDCDALIYTVAMPSDNPEYAYAKEHGIPVISRADFLGYIMTEYKKRIGVSGTHGKSTTTGMIAKILSTAGADPTVFNGAPMKDTHSADIIGKNDFFVFEACEYMDSFLDFNPTLAIVLNVELDHVDYFKSIEQMINSYSAFMNLTGKDGFAVINYDDENAKKAAEKYIGNIVSFSRGNALASYCSVNEKVDSGYCEFDIAEKGKTIAHVNLNVPGEHEIYDALAAFAACSVYGIPPKVIAEGLSNYKGISRRMDKVCVTKKGADIYADYAHHPTEISSTLAGAEKICRGNLRVIFQPHTFSRTAELFDDFVSVFNNCKADEVILYDIYPAREKNIYGVYSEDISEKLKESGKKSSVFHDFEKAAEYLDKVSEKGDISIVMGAGDIIKIAEILEKKYN